jgi:hypothetical protein
MLSLNGSEALSLLKLSCEPAIFGDLKERHQNVVVSLVTLLSATYDSPSLSSTDPMLRTIIQSYRSALRTFERDVPKDDHLLTREWTKLNVNFPNNSSLDSFPSQTDFLGRPEFGDTSKVMDHFEKLKLLV